jgi:rubrerythrin
MSGKQTMLRGAVSGVFVFGVAYGGANEPQKPEAKSRTTVENLQVAYEGESNAAAKYAAFAKKADEEGYAPVASLFRAAARAEEIHAKNHSEVIKKMGAEPKAVVRPPDVKTTKLNLEAALAGESYERDNMYPEFIAVATKEKNKEAMRTFNFALTAEAEHAKLYSDGLSNLDKWKGSEKRDFFVCTVCGYTTVKIDFEKCPSCFTHKEEYIKIN